MITDLSTITTQTMSSVEIAELTGKRHADVLRDIRETLEVAEINVSIFADVYTDGLNKGKIKQYNLPRRECDLVISGYSVPYRLKIIDRWRELEMGQQQPVTHLLPVEKGTRSIEGAIKAFDLLGVPKHRAIVEAAKIGYVESQGSLDARDAVSDSKYCQDLQADDLWLEVTEIGSMIGLSARSVNRCLESMGYQLKRGTSWTATDKAQGLYNLHAWSRGSKSGVNLKWNVGKILPVLKSYVDKP